MHSEETSDANSELFKKDYDEALHENTRVKLNSDLIGASLN